MRIDDFGVDPLFVAEISAASPVGGEEEKRERERKIKTFVIENAKQGFSLCFPSFSLIREKRRKLFQGKVTNSFGAFMLEN
jgi:hypothetical protein